MSRAVVDRGRTVDVTRVLEPERRLLRVRFRAPPSLAGRAVLLREEEGARRAWRYVPSRKQSEPFSWPSGTQELGGTGLRWSDLWGLDAGAGKFRLEARGTLELSESLRVRVLQVRARREGMIALLHLDEEHRLPLLLDERRGEEARLVRRSRWKAVGEHWLALRWRIEAEGAVSTVEVTKHALEAPDAHLDPSRFQRP